MGRGGVRGSESNGLPCEGSPLAGVLSAVTEPAFCTGGGQSQHYLLCALPDAGADANTIRAGAGEVKNSRRIRGPDLSAMLKPQSAVALPIQSSPPGDGRFPRNWMCHYPGQGTGAVLHLSPVRMTNRIYAALRPLHDG